MKSSLAVLGFFTAGCWLGTRPELPEFLRGGLLPLAALYLLMLEVGVSLGSDAKLKEILRSVKLRWLLLPAGTAAGTLLGALAASVFITRWSWSECLAVGSGFGYYSLSSILIAQLKEPVLGAQAAGALATVALLSNMIREMFTLLFAPLLVRFFGKFAPVAAGGVTSMDATLPVIARYSGKDMTFLAIVHGVTLDFSVPFLVAFFCSL